MPPTPSRPAPVANVQPVQPKPPQPTPAVPIEKPQPKPNDDTPRPITNPKLELNMEKVASDTLHITKKSGENVASEEQNLDEIYIDLRGNLHHRDEEADNKTKESA